MELLKNKINKKLSEKNMKFILKSNMFLRNLGRSEEFATSDVNYLEKIFTVSGSMLLSFAGGV